MPEIVISENKNGFEYAVHLDSSDSYNSEAISCKICMFLEIEKNTLKNFTLIISRAIDIFLEKIGNRTHKNLFPQTRYQTSLPDDIRHVGIEILINKGGEFSSEVIKIYLLSILKALQEASIISFPIFGEETRKIERESGLVLPFFIKNCLDQDINPLAGVIFSRKDFDEFELTYHSARMALSELHYLNARKNLEQNQHDVLSLLSRIEEVYHKDSSTYKSYEKLWRKCQQKSFVERAYELLKNYSSHSFLRGRWNLSHHLAIGSFLTTYDANEAPSKFLDRLMHQEVRNPSGSLSRRMHFIMMKGIEETDLFPNIYACIAQEQELQATASSSRRV